MTDTLVHAVEPPPAAIILKSLFSNMLPWKPILESGYIAKTANLKSLY